MACCPPLHSGRGKVVSEEEKMMECEVRERK